MQLEAAHRDIDGTRSRGEGPEKDQPEELRSLSHISMAIRSEQLDF
jgi:hypothetical protein